MCTSIAARLNDFYFGRTLDLDHDFGESVIITPRNLPFRFRDGRITRRHYAFCGMGQAVDGYPLCADAMNERGLCIAALNFPRNAYYPTHVQDGKRCLAPFEVIPAIMAECATLEDVRRMLSDTAVCDVPFSDELPNTPLHWHIADKSGSIVFEVTRVGGNVYENAHGVLTNNPPFPFHRDNMALYLNISRDMPRCEVFGNGVLGHGMPGDYSSPSRFVRASLLSHMTEGNGGMEDFFAILGAISVPRGSVVNAEGALHYTRYCCCMDTHEGIYAFRTCRDSRTRYVSMKKESLDSETLLIFDIDDRDEARRLDQPKIL